MRAMPMSKGKNLGRLIHKLKNMREFAEERT